MPCAFAHSRTSVLSIPSARARRPPRAGRRVPPPAPRAAPHVARQRIPQRLGVLGVQVDLVLGAVQPEADSAFSLAAIEVVDKQGLYLLGHGCSISSLTSPSAFVGRSSHVDGAGRTIASLLRHRQRRRFPCHGCGSCVDRGPWPAPDRRVVRSEQLPAAAASRPPARGAALVPLLFQPAGERPARMGFSWRPSGRPARPIAFAVVKTMRTGFEVGPRVGRQERMCWRRIGSARFQPPARRSSPTRSLSTGAHDRPR